MVAIGSEEVCSETMAFVEDDKDEEEKKMNGATQHCNPNLRQNETNP